MTSASDEALSVNISNINDNKESMTDENCSAPGNAFQLSDKSVLKNETNEPIRSNSDVREFNSVKKEIELSDENSNKIEIDEAPILKRKLIASSTINELIEKQDLTCDPDDTNLIVTKIVKKLVDDVSSSNQNPDVLSETLTSNDLPVTSSISPPSEIGKIKTPIIPKPKEKLPVVTVTDEDTITKKTELNNNERTPIKIKLSVPKQSNSVTKKFVATPISEEVLKPFEIGWRRELVMRTTSGDSPGAKRQGDVYYYTPENKKLRSMPEILAYLKIHPEMELLQHNFTFSKQQIYKEPEEIVRNARDSKTLGKTIIKAPPQPTSNKRKIKPINREYPGEIFSYKENSSVLWQHETEDDELPKPVSKKPRIKLTTKYSKNEPLKEKVEKTLNSPLCKSDVDQMTEQSSEFKMENWEPLCSLNCPDRNFAVPSSLCCVCLCLFHPECVNFDPSTGKSLICPRCLQEITEGKTKAPLSAKETLVSLLFPECAKKLKPNSTTNSAAKDNDQSESSLPLSVANALSLQSTSIKPNITQALNAKKNNDSTPDVSFPLSIQKSSFMPSSTSVAPDISLIPVTSVTNPVMNTVTNPVTNSLISGTLIFTKPVNQPTITTQLTPTIPNSPTLAPIINQPILNIPTPLNPTLNVRVPTVPTVGIKLPPTNINPVTANPKYILHMIPDTTGGMRYVLSPSENQIPRAPAPPLPVVYASPPVTVKPDDTGNQTCEIVGNKVKIAPNESPLQTVGLKPNSVQATPIVNGSKQEESSENTSTVPIIQQNEKVLMTNNNSASSGKASTAMKTIETKTNAKPVSKKIRHMQTCHFDLLHSGYTSFMCIFQYLRERDLLRCGQVCKTWRNLVNQSVLWRYVSLKNLLVTDWQICVQFLTKRGVTGLNLIDIKSKDEQRMWRDFLSTLRYLGSLKKLNFHKVSASVLLAVSDQLTSLEVLTATDICDITNAGFGGTCYLDIGKLQQLVQLRELQLHSNNGISIPKFSFAGGFSSLKILKNLSLLTLTSFKDLSSEDISFLGMLTNLTELEIGDCTNFDAQAYETLGGLVNLRKLRLEVTESCDEAIAKCIVKLVNLRDFGLILTQVTPCIAESFSSLTKIEKLTLWPCNNQREHSYTNIHRVLPKLNSLAKLQWGIVVNDSELTNSKDKAMPEESNINSVNIRIPFIDNISSNPVVKTVDTKTLLHSLRLALPSTIVNIMFAPTAVAYRVSRMSSL